MLVFATPKWADSSLISAVLALPSTAGSRINAKIDPSSSCSISGPFLDPGLTFIVYLIYYPRTVARSQISAEFDERAAPG